MNKIAAINVLLKHAQKYITKENKVKITNF